MIKTGKVGEIVNSKNEDIIINDNPKGEKQQSIEPKEETIEKPKLKPQKKKKFVLIHDNHGNVYIKQRPLKETLWLWLDKDIINKVRSKSKSPSSYIGMILKKHFQEIENNDKRTN